MSRRCEVGEVVVWTPALGPKARGVVVELFTTSPGDPAVVVEIDGGEGAQPRRVRVCEDRLRSGRIMPTGAPQLPEKMTTTGMRPRARTRRVDSMVGGGA